MRYETSNCLMHYGIKGQQWGVRRFQNLDGSLTAEGKERYSGLHREDEIEKDFQNYVKTNSEQIANIASMSKELQKLGSQRYQAFKDFYSNVEITPEQKHKCEQIIDSWYGSKLDESQRDAYDHDIHELAYKNLAPSVSNNVPKKLEDLDSKYYKKLSEYNKAVKTFTDDLINRYANTIAYTTRKGLLGIELINKQTNGKEFINNLIDKNELLVQLGAVKTNGQYYKYRALGPKLDTKAEQILDDAIDRFAKAINFDWYNKRKKG